MIDLIRGRALTDVLYAGAAIQYARESEDDIGTIKALEQMKHDIIDLDALSADHRARLCRGLDVQIRYIADYFGLTLQTVNHDDF